MIGLKLFGILSLLIYSRSEYFFSLLVNFTDFDLKIILEIFRTQAVCCAVKIKENSQVL